jgi:hypothetical protein
VSAGSTVSASCGGEGRALNTRSPVGPLLSIMNTVSDVPERWSHASVYPDMWADPDEDPRNNDGVSPDGELATLQDYWRNWILPERQAPRLYRADDADFEGATAEQALVDGAFADLAGEQAATDAVLADYPDLGRRVGRDGIAVRELWVHRIEEYARHCGHADLLRECIDGRVGQ